MYQSTKLIAITVLLFSFLVVKAQPWLPPLRKQNLPFAETQKAAHDYFSKNSPNKNMENKKAYKLFKQWEWLNQSKLLADGTIANPTISLLEWQKYQANQRRQTTVLGTTVFGVKNTTGNWVSKGPFTDNGGGYNGIGRLNAIAFHPTNANIFWVGSPAGGIWKTTDGGNTWASNTDTLSTMGVNCIVVDPTNPNNIYVATGDADGGDLPSSGVIRSIDGGKTWLTTGLSWPRNDYNQIARLVINPKNNNKLVLAAFDSIHLSNDKGVHWKTAIFPDNIGATFKDLAFCPNDSAIVYAAATCYPDSRILRSTNGGNTWDTIASLKNAYRVTLAVTANAPNIVEALGANLQGGMVGIWRSVDFGKTFTKYFDGTAPNNLIGYAADGNSQGGQGWYTLSFKVNPNNYKEKWVGGVNTWHTIDNGKTWKLVTFWYEDANLNVTPVHADKHYYAYNPIQKNAFYECNDGGLYRTLDSGKTWKDLSNGLIISQIYRVGVAQTTKNMAICGLQDNGTKELNGSNWQQVDGGDGTYSIIDYTDTSYQYGGYTGGTFFRLTNKQGISSYADITKNIPLDSTEMYADSTPNGAWLTPFTIDPKTPSTLYVGYKKVYKTTNRGNSWVAISPLLTSNDLYRIAVAPSNPNVIWVSTLDSLYYTINGGTTWKKIFKSKLGVQDTDNAFITRIAINSANANTVWVTFSGYAAPKKVYKTTNGGTSWKNMTGNLPNVPVHAIICQNGATDTVYIGTDVGVFYRDSSMTSWLSYNNGLPHVTVNDLAISYLDKKLWAATYGRGLWSSDTYSSILPLSFISINAYLNNNTALIKWQTANEENVAQFIIEHSNDGISFSAIGSINADDGITNSYQFTDYSPAIGSNYYRIKSIDKEGSNSYSSVVRAEWLVISKQFTLVPNPAKSMVNLQFGNINATAITIYSVDGKQLFTQLLKNTSSSYPLNIEQLASGIYIVEVKTATDSYKQKLVVQ